MIRDTKRLPKSHGLTKNVRSGFTERQSRFIKEYTIDRNGTKAAIRAGYGERVAAAEASKLLKLPKIRDALSRVLEVREKRTMIAAENVLLELGKIAFADPRKCFDNEGKLLHPKEWPDEIAHAIQSMDIEEIKEPYTGEVLGQIKKIKFWDKNKALDNLGKHFKLFSDKIEIDIGDSLAEKLADARRRAIEMVRPSLDAYVKLPKADEPEEE